MIEIPLSCHLELRRVDLVKWEGKIFELLNELAFLWPEKANDLAVVPIYNPSIAELMCNKL